MIVSCILITQFQHNNYQHTTWDNDNNNGDNYADVMDIGMTLSQTRWTHQFMAPATTTNG